MAFSTTALQGTAAAICMVLVLSSVGKPASGKCIQSCIKQCPSKCNAYAESTCQEYKNQDNGRCMTSCDMYCPSACGGSSPEQCKIDHCSSSTVGPLYRGCVGSALHECTEKCEKDCQGNN